MAYRTFADVKSFAMQMLSEDELNQVYQQGLLSRWATSVRDRVTEHHSWKWKEGELELTWPGNPGTSRGSMLYLPEYVGQILTITPTGAVGTRTIQIVDRWAFDDAWRYGRTPTDALIIWGYYGVERDNPSTAALDIVATGAANANGVRCLVVGIDQNGRQASEVVQLAGAGTGTTTKQYLGGVGRDGVRIFQLDRASLVGKVNMGRIELRNGGTVIESLDADAGEIAHEHQKTELFVSGGISGAAASFNIAYYRRYPELRTDSDLYLVDVPSEFSDIVEAGIMSRICAFRRDWPSKTQYEVEFKERLRDLVSWTNRAPGSKFYMSINKQWGGRRQGAFRR